MWMNAQEDCVHVSTNTKYDLSLCWNRKEVIDLTLQTMKHNSLSNWPASNEPSLSNYIWFQRGNTAIIIVTFRDPMTTGESRKYILRLSWKICSLQDRGPAGDNKPLSYHQNVRQDHSLTKECVKLSGLRVKTRRLLKKIRKPKNPHGGGTVRLMKVMEK
jgi:hypothetical protein